MNCESDHREQVDELATARKFHSLRREGKVSKLDSKGSSDDTCHMATIPPSFFSLSILLR